MRLDKLLASSGFGSRKDVKKLVKARAVTVNGEVAKQVKDHVDPSNDEVLVHGERVEYKEFIYLMMNKPDGVISATEDLRDETVVDLLEPEDIAREPFPVGRLDKDTVGLLLLTNDGQLAHQLLSPKKHVPKTYEVHLKYPLGDQDIKRLEEGVVILDDYCTKPAKVEVDANENEDTRIRLMITEGKYHQVKLMAQAVGNEVIFLKRLSMGAVSLDEDLAPGEYRELTDEELDSLINRP
ncbi:pseudouridine synthase [Bacillus pumilus]|uniref:pseudouridine synthase n=1 Tax=Bacillus TaxID=1386 RepID=UPI000D029792|nr:MULTISPECIES: pseudouridine synthase [Bacillus]MDF2003174.1 pseudouridine synthase [Bacillus pumilus]MDF2024099.1 pseudouridine synthase [Bacillus pumilus]MDF2028056.1 pseudouridine synthase [Bacillus pumilus]MDF2088985.1 pseudouridine synthase [Bacillus pumilus]PRS51869.1 16S rRNA pseudouridine(516) synthase [Bacillus sp. MZGC1]